MSRSNAAGETARGEALNRLRAESDGLLLLLDREIDRLEARREAASQSQKDAIDIRIDDLTRANAALGDAYLRNVATIIDLDGLLASLQQETDRLNDEAAKIGSVAAMLKVADALLGIASASISLFDNAPKTP